MRPEQGSILPHRPNLGGAVFKGGGDSEKLQIRLLDILLEGVEDGRNERRDWRHSPMSTRGNGKDRIQA